MRLDLFQDLCLISPLLTEEVCDDRLVSHELMYIIPAGSSTRLGNLYDIFLSKEGSLN